MEQAATREGDAGQEGLARCQREWGVGNRVVMK